MVVVSCFASDAAKPAIMPPCSHTGWHARANQVDAPKYKPCARGLTARVFKRGKCAKHQVYPSEQACGAHRLISDRRYHRAPAVLLDRVCD